MLKIVGAIVVVYVVMSGVLFAVMLQSPDQFAQTVKHVPWPAWMVLPFKPLWNVARNGHLSVGDAAPDFALDSPDHNNHFQLSLLRGQKPVVLVFGSYT
jgi:hypothetical protein